MMVVLFALLLGAGSCLGDSIHAATGSSSDGNSVGDVSQLGVPFSNYQGYFSQSASGFNSALDFPAFAELGTTPGTFLFTVNTMFAFNGTPVITILIANVNLAQGSLNDPGAQAISFGLQGSGSQSVPEPRSLYIFAFGLLLISCGRMRRLRSR